MKNTKMKNEAGNKSKPNKVETSQISQILETVGDLLNDTVLSFSLSFFISSFLSLTVSIINRRRVLTGRNDDSLSERLHNENCS